MELLSLLLKATLLFLAAFGVAYLSRRTPRRTHQMWTVVCVAVVVMPMLAALLPPVAVPFPSSRSHDQPVGSSAATAVGASPAPGAGSALTARTTLAPSSPGPEVLRGSVHTLFRWPGQAIWLGGWIAGAGVAILMILVSLFRVHRLSTSADDLRDPVWESSLAEISQRLGLRQQVRLLISDEIDGPMAGEFRRPTVFLPAAARGWNAECREAVLAHELAHLAGHDPGRHLAARLMLAMYWFHPLAWIAARQGALACEDACDEAVLRLGVRPSSYARVLLELSESAQPRRREIAALPIVPRSHLERRLVTILHSKAGAAPAPPAALPAIACALLAVLLASAQPRARAVDAAGRPQASDPLVSAFDGAEPTDSACWDVAVKGSAGGETRRPFEKIPNGTIVSERIESKGYTRAIWKSFGDLRVCLVARELAAASSKRPNAMLRAAPRVVLEVQHGATVQRLDISNTGAKPVATWRVNGVPRSIGSDVDGWRRSAVVVLDTTWQLAMLRGAAQTEDHDRRTAELEIRREAELTELLRVVRTIERQPLAVSSTLSVCDMIDGGTTGGRRQPRYLRERFGDLETCVRIDEGNVFETVRPSELMRRATYAVLEARRGELVQQLEIRQDDAGAIHEAWRLNGVRRPMDPAAESWKARIVDVLDTSWDIWALRGQEGELQGRIGEIHGRLANGEIRQRDAEIRIQSIRAQIAALNLDGRIARWTDRRQEQISRFHAAMAAVE